MLSREEILTILESYKQNKKNIIDEIGIFGSYAREEAHQDSDIDVFVRLRKSNLFLLSRIRIELEELFGKHVDIVEVRERMNKYLKKHIDKEAVSV